MVTRTLPLSWRDFWQRPGRWIRTVGGGPVPAAPPERSGGRSSARCWPFTGRSSAPVPVLPNAGACRRIGRMRERRCVVEELAPQDLTGRTAVQLDVVEGVGENLGGPDQPCLYIPAL